MFSEKFQWKLQDFLGIIDVLIINNVNSNDSNNVTEIYHAPALTGVSNCNEALGVSASNIFSANGADNNLLRLDDFRMDSILYESLTCIFVVM